MLVASEVPRVDGHRQRARVGLVVVLVRLPQEGIRSSRRQRPRQRNESGLRGEPPPPRPPLPRPVRPRLTLHLRQPRLHVEPRKQPRSRHSFAENCRLPPTLNSFASSRPIGRVPSLATRWSRKPPRCSSNSPSFSLVSLTSYQRRCESVIGRSLSGRLLGLALATLSCDLDPWLPVQKSRPARQAFSLPLLPLLPLPPPLHLLLPRLECQR